MHQFVTEMYTSATKWCIVEYLFGALWDLLDGFNNVWSANQAIT